MPPLPQQAEAEMFTDALRHVVELWLDFSFDISCQVTRVL